MSTIFSRLYAFTYDMLFRLTRRIYLFASRWTSSKPSILPPPPPSTSYSTTSLSSSPLITNYISIDMEDKSSLNHLPKHNGQTNSTTIPSQLPIEKLADETNISSFVDIDIDKQLSQSILLQQSDVSNPRIFPSLTEIVELVDKTDTIPCTSFAHLESSIVEVNPCASISTYSSIEATPMPIYNNCNARDAKYNLDVENMSTCVVNEALNDPPILEVDPCMSMLTYSSIEATSISISNSNASDPNIKFEGVQNISAWNINETQPELPIPTVNPCTSMSSSKKNSTPIVSTQSNINDVNKKVKARHRDLKSKVLKPSSIDPNGSYQGQYPAKSSLTKDAEGDQIREGLSSDIKPVKSKRPKKRKKDKRDGSRADNAESEAATRPNFFVAFQVSNKDIKSKMMEVQAKMLEKELTSPSVTKISTKANLFKDTMVPVDKLHFTLHVFHLKDQEELQKAVEILERCFSKCREEFEKDPLTVNIQGLGHFRNSVLFAKIQGEGHISRLESVCDALRTEFDGMNIKGDSKVFKPHMTIAKMSRSKKLHKKKVRSFPPEMWSEFESQHFGYQNVESLQLLSMMETDPVTGYYRSVAEFNFLGDHLHTPTSTDINSSSQIQTEMEQSKGQETIKVHTWFESMELDLENETSVNKD